MTTRTRSNSYRAFVVRTIRLSRGGLDNKLVGDTKEAPTTKELTCGIVSFHEYCYHPEHNFFNPNLTLGILHKENKLIAPFPQS